MNERIAALMHRMKALEEELEVELAHPHIDLGYQVRDQVRPTGDRSAQRYAAFTVHGDAEAEAYRRELTELRKQVQDASRGDSDP